ncbi:hypothetical protein [Corallococcus silvisoli]|uniref:hypothetical protein n=1 Tax=Corallococcus silvisoli TaxID=2697031 RepID=UPI001377843C|nr:hypothetical protein [Corallococcus silvisoli]NBD14022.1 hypothetical protein [Corallococcus silvisoli]
MTLRYAPFAIKQHAEGLNRQASLSVFLYGFLGFLVGAWGGGAIGGTETDVGLAIIWLGGIVGMLIGGSIGRRRAMTLELQAKTVRPRVDHLR